MNRVGVQTNGLAISIVMVSERGFHILESDSIVDRGGTIGRIAKSRAVRYLVVFLQPLKNLQPRIHEMRASDASTIEKGIKRNLPEPWKFGFTLANTRGRQAIVGETIVQSIWPKGISVFLSDRNGGGC